MPLWHYQELIRHSLTNGDFVRIFWQLSKVISSLHIVITISNLMIHGDCKSLIIFSWHVCQPTIFSPKKNRFIWQPNKLTHCTTSLPAISLKSICCLSDLCRWCIHRSFFLECYFIGKDGNNHQLKNLILPTEGHWLYSYEPISSPFQRFARYNFSDNSFPKDVIILITFSKKLDLCCIKWSKIWQLEKCIYTGRSNIIWIIYLKEVVFSWVIEPLYGYFSCPLF